MDGQQDGSQMNGRTGSDDSQTTRNVGMGKETEGVVDVETSGVEHEVRPQSALDGLEIENDGVVGPCTLSLVEGERERKPGSDYSHRTDKRPPQS